MSLHSAVVQDDEEKSYRIFGGYSFVPPSVRYEKTKAAGNSCHKNFSAKELFLIKSHMIIILMFKYMNYG